MTTYNGGHTNLATLPVAPWYTELGAKRAPSISGNGSSAFWAPGFIDLQVNGYHGVDYSGATLDSEGIDHVVQELLRTGTTRHMPTIITNSQERICKNLSILREYRASSPQRRLSVVGVHVEGPYISSEDGPRGAHDPAHVRDPSWTEVQEWIDAAGGDLAMVTLAPERSGAIALTEKLVAAGVIVAIGHTAASAKDIQAAVAAGARMSTHLGNGSHAHLPRLDNYLWSQLAEETLVAGLITDGFHLPTAAMKSIIRAKGLENILLVSDVAPLAGCSVGVTQWGEMSVEVHQDGHISLAGTPFLAGAGHLLNHNISHAVRSGALSLIEAISCCTTGVLPLVSPEAYSWSPEPHGEHDFLDRVYCTVHHDSQDLEITHAIRGGALVLQSSQLVSGGAH